MRLIHNKKKPDLSSSKLVNFPLIKRSQTTAWPFRNRNNLALMNEADLCDLYGDLVRLTACMAAELDSRDYEGTLSLDQEMRIREKSMNLFSTCRNLKASGFLP